MEGVSNAFKREMESEEQKKKCHKHQPPDGGWGWVIVIAYAIQNMILLPILINFGLMYRDVFEKLKMTNTDSSIIINANSAAGLLFGLLNGPLLKTFGYRKVACVGALLTFFGNAMTSFAMSSFEFILYYGIISSIGIALVMASFSLALNTYFLNRRGVATALAMSATGLGPVFMPLAISQLMQQYGGRGTALIMAAMTLHSFVGAMLLQPVKWHYIKVKDTEKGEDAGNGANEIEDKNKEHRSSFVANDNLSVDRSSGVIPLRGTTELSASKCSLNSPDGASKVLPLNDVTDSKTAQMKTDNDKFKTYNISESDRSEAEKFIENDNVRVTAMKTEETNDVKTRKSWRSRLFDIFDLDLLQEPVFRNIWIGMAIAFTAEMNFTLMTPFILGDLGYDTKETAKMMSFMGISDIASRLLSPFIGSKVKLPTRYMYLLSLIILVTFRFYLTVVTTYAQLVFVLIALGVGRGFLSVYRSLVVPNHVPLEKLPSASGLTTVLNGICLLSFGPVLGYIRDLMGNYNWYIYVLNILSMITIAMWSVEFISRMLSYKQEAAR